VKQLTVAERQLQRDIPDLAERLGNEHRHAGGVIVGRPT